MASNFGLKVESNELGELCFAFYKGNIFAELDKKHLFPSPTEAEALADACGVDGIANGR